MVGVHDHMASLPKCNTSGMNGGTLVDSLG